MFRGISLKFDIFDNTSLQKNCFKNFHFLSLTLSHKKANQAIRWVIQNNFSMLIHYSLPPATNVTKRT